MQNNIPPYYSYPQYGYVPQPSHYSPYMNSYINSSPAYNNAQYLNHSINDYGQLAAESSSIPPKINQHYLEYNPTTNYGPILPTHESHVYPVVYDPAYFHGHVNNPGQHYSHNYHNHQHHHHHDQHSNSSSYQTTKTISSSSTKKNPRDIIPAVLPANDGYEQYYVQDLTDRGSIS